MIAHGGRPAQWRAPISAIMRGAMETNGEAIAKKLGRLRERLRALGSAVVAFSAGVDSTLLLCVAHEVLGDRAVAATVRSQTLPRRELEEAVRFCRARGIRHRIVDFDALALPQVAGNSPDRCYHCKKALLGKLLSLAGEVGAAAVAEGSNVDDDGDFRPGRQAVGELGVASPLHDAGLTKSDIRALSRAMGLAAWDKPSFACLASRIPHGERITAEILSRVERAEEWLSDSGMGLRQLRVRAHGDIARIEVPLPDVPRVAAHAAEVCSEMTRLGFRRVTLDLAGYRTGSMNEPPAAASVSRRP